MINPDLSKKKFILVLGLLLIMLLAMSTNLMAANQIVTNNSDSGAGSLRQALVDVGAGDEITFNVSGSTKYAFHNGTSWMKVEDGTTVVADENVTEITTDQRGFARIGTTDIGAFEYQAPTITTQAVSSIGATTATGNGNITDFGVSDPSQYGVCWSTSENPTIENDKTTEGTPSAVGAFTSEMTNLSANTTYYVRAYATNTEDTGYGEQVSFTTLMAAPFENLTVNETTGLFSRTSPILISSDNFDSYSPGDYLRAVAPVLWTTWSNALATSEYFVVTAEDVIVTNAKANSLPNSILVKSNNDCVMIMKDYTSGVYSIDIDMYVPTGSCGYYNLQKTSTPGVEWGFEAYFTDGEVSVNAGGNAAATCTFVHGEWMDLCVVVDLDADLAKFSVNGVEVISWTWTGGATGGSGLLQLGGMNIYGVGDTNQKFYVDNMEFKKIVPTVTTTVVSSVTATTALSGGNVTSDGGSAITARGVCWSTSTNPTIVDNYTTDETGTGTFTSSMTGLLTNTTYYVRAYATNSAGTSYGSEVSFTTLDGTGVPPDVQDAGPNNGDGNGDGTTDSTQTTVASLPAVTGEGYLTVEITDCDQIEQVAAYTYDSVGINDPGHSYPFGLVGFEIPCSSATVRIYYHGAANLDGYIYRKYGPTPANWGTSRWYTMTGVTFSTKGIGEQTVPYVEFDLAESGLGDDTNGDSTIIDKGGPGLFDPSSIPTLSEWGDDHTLPAYHHRGFYNHPQTAFLNFHIVIPVTGGASRYHL